MDDLIRQFQVAIPPEQAGKMLEDAGHLGLPILDKTKSFWSGSMTVNHEENID
jgi:hypothetical protein